MNSDSADPSIEGAFHAGVRPRSNCVHVHDISRRAAGLQGGGLGFSLMGWRYCGDVPCQGGGALPSVPVREDTHQRLIRARNINSRAGCACQGDTHQREQPQRRGCSGAVRSRGRGQASTTGHCMPASAVVVGRLRVHRPAVHLFREACPAGLVCRRQRCGSVPSMQMARTTKVLGTLASMGMRWVENWFSEVRLSLARLTR